MRIWKWLSAFAMALIFGIASCGEDPVEFRPGNDYALVIQDGAVLPDGLVVFLTTESGKLLYSTSWEPGDDNRITVYAPRDFTGKVNFHYASRSQMSAIQHQYGVRTVADVLPGAEIPWPSGKPYVPFTWHPKSHRLTVQDIPTDQYTKMWQLGPTATPRSEFVNSTEQTFATPLLPGPLTYILEGDNSVTPQYLRLSNALPDETLTIGFSEFLPAEKVNVTVSEMVDLASLQIYATFEESQPQFVYSGEVEDAESFALYYYPESLFEDYETLLRLYTDDFYYSYTRYGGRVSEVNLPDVQISALSVTDRTLTATVSGTYDSLYIIGNTNWEIAEQEYLLSWTVVLRAPAQPVTLPDLAGILDNYWPEMKQMPETGFHGITLRRSTLDGTDREEWNISKQFD